MKFLLCMLSIVFLERAVQASSITFEVKSHLPQKKEIYLEDVAVLSTEDDYTIGALRGIKIADSAKDAERMTAQEIVRKIRPQLKIIERHCDCKLQIHIPKEMTDFSLSGAFVPDKLITKIEKTIQEECLLCIVEIKTPQLLRGKIPTTYKHWSSPLPPNELKGMSMVRVYFDDKALNPVVYQMYVGVKKPILKLTHSLAAGTQPQMKDFQKEIVDMTFDNRSFASEIDLENTELKRSLSVGEILATNDLILRYKIKRGETVKVILKNSNLEMEMTGVAQKQGRIGDKITVRLASTRKEVLGEILDDGRVAL